MKKSIIKRMVAMTMAATLCFGTAFNSAAGTLYCSDVPNVSTTPVYSDNRDFDLLSSMDLIIASLYKANGTPDMVNTGITASDATSIRKIGEILDTVLSDYENLTVMESYEADRLYRTGKNSLAVEGSQNKNKTVIYVGWDTDDDNTATIDKIKAAVEEAKRIASTIPDGSDDDKLRFIYNYMENKHIQIDLYNSSLYDTLILNKGCCRGVNAAIYLIGLYANLPVGVMSYRTDDGVPHGANYTYYEDGSIKYTDASWGHFVLANDYKR